MNPFAKYIVALWCLLAFATVVLVGGLLVYLFGTPVGIAATALFVAACVAGEWSGRAAMRREFRDRLATARKARRTWPD